MTVASKNVDGIMTGQELKFAIANNLPVWFFLRWADVDKRGGNFNGSIKISELMGKGYIESSDFENEDLVAVKNEVCVFIIYRLKNINYV